MHAVRSLAWTMDGKMLVSGSYDCSIRTWDTTKWEQIAVLDEHTDFVFTIAISPNGRILASPSRDRTVRLWNLDNGQPISSPLQHAEPIDYVSFSQDGKLLATGCRDKNAYTWNIAAILREAGLDDLLSYPKANKSITHSNSTRRLVQRRPPAFRAPQGFFHGVPPGHSQFSAQSHTRSSEPRGSTPLHRLFHRRPSNAQDTSPSSPLEWARALLKWRGQSSEGTELQGRSPVAVEVPHAKGKRRNASAREVALAKQKQKMRALNSKNSTAASLQHHKPIVVKPSSQPQPAVSNSSIAPAVGDNTAATTPPPRPDVILRQAGLWTRFWLLICCLSPEYQDDGRH
ncbi:WD40-repeat-containing domain protein [Suillus americanus]|nr:WD40-repeat-containing domain protein [Suillus americanus]